MKIERVDDKTVKCFLSNEELEEYEIDYKDFVLRSEKAKQLVQEIIEQAEEQVGYKPPKFSFDMQIMVLPEQGLLLTFSESDSVNVPDARRILEYLKEMKQTLQQTQEQLGILEQNQPEKHSKPEKQRNPESAVFAFETLRQVMDYAKVLPTNLRIQSALYVMDDVYYLFLQKGGAAYERYSRACIQAMEFGQLHGAGEDSVLPLQEHGTCLIREKAIRRLASF